MRELEFLPAWYPRLRQRKRQVLWQTYATFALLIALFGWGWLSGRNIHTAAASLVELKEQLTDTDSKLHQLQDKIEQQRALLSKERVRLRLGGHVEATRIFSAIEKAMPDEMSLVLLTTEVEEVPRNLTGLAATLATQQGAGMQRRAKITIIANGPTGNTVARFTQSLLDTNYFSTVNMGVSQDVVENNHVLRKFEVTLYIDLDSVKPPGGF